MFKIDKESNAVIGPIINAFHDSGKMYLKMKVYSEYKESVGIKFFVFWFTPAEIYTGFLKIKNVKYLKYYVYLN